MPRVLRALRADEGTGAGKIPDAIDAVLLPIATFIGVVLGVVPFLIVVGLGRSMVRSMRRRGSGDLP